LVEDWAALSEDEAVVVAEVMADPAKGMVQRNVDIGRYVSYMPSARRDALHHGAVHAAVRLATALRSCLHCINPGLLGQFVETRNNVVLAMDGSVRTARVAVYTLLNLRKQVPDRR
jgi:hypothetical protein